MNLKKDGVSVPHKAKLIVSVDRRSYKLNQLAEEKADDIVRPDITGSYDNIAEPEITGRNSPAPNGDRELAELNDQSNSPPDITIGQCMSMARLVPPRLPTVPLPVSESRAIAPVNLQPSPSPVRTAPRSSSAVLPRPSPASVLPKVISSTPVQIQNNSPSPNAALKRTPQATSSITLSPSLSKAASAIALSPGAIKKTEIRSPTPPAADTKCSPVDRPSPPSVTRPPPPSLPGLAEASVSSPDQLSSKPEGLKVKSFSHLRENETQAPRAEEKRHWTTVDEKSNQKGE